jgi:CheY-like chemotaxis protein
MNLLPDPAGTSLPTIALVGADSPFLNSVAAALGSMRVITPAVLKVPIEQALGRPELDAAAVIVVDIDSKRRGEPRGPSGLMARLGGRAPVIALTDSFDDGLARWFLQVRVADFLRKPVDAKEVLRACVRALRATSEMPGDQGQIFSFLGAAGGVGTTTLAIETRCSSYATPRKRTRPASSISISAAAPASTTSTWRHGSISTRSGRTRSASTCNSSRSC